MLNRPLKIGTRRSALAMKQTSMVCDALKKAHPHLCAQGAIEIIEIETLGDRTQKENMSLAEHGGKALWASEHEAAMRAGLIDFAVHSVKDIQGILDDDMVMPFMLPREDARDVFISEKADHYLTLPEGAIVGTSSPRRAACVLSKRPDIQIVTFRGNVGTRLAKIEKGDVDATFLAAAGLKRMGYMDDAFASIYKSYMSPDDMLPAVGQGAIGLEFKKDRHDLFDLLAKIHCPETGIRIGAERAWLAGMGGSCRSPLAALAEYQDGVLRLRAFAANLTGNDTRLRDEKRHIETVAEAEAFGAALAVEMLKDLPRGFV